jgi:hypothetical protein
VSPAAVRPLSGGYWSVSRAPRYSLLFVLPLFVLYEALASALAAPGVESVRNAADVVLKTPFMLFSGARGSMVFFATVIAVCVYLVGRDLKKSGGRLQPRLFASMFAESAVLALLLGIVVGTLTQQLLGGLAGLSMQAGSPMQQMGVGTRLMLSLGAGLYEELLFRVLLVGGLAWLFARFLGGSRIVAGLLAACIGALVFSAFHYIGQYGDPFELGSFTYRAIAGLVFSGLYLTRGFGITAWTHALYDVYVMIILA